MISRLHGSVMTSGTQTERRLLPRWVGGSYTAIAFFGMFISAMSLIEHPLGCSQLIVLDMLHRLVLEYRNVVYPLFTRFWPENWLFPPAWAIDVITAVTLSSSMFVRSYLGIIKRYLDIVSEWAQEKGFKISLFAYLRTIRNAVRESFPKIASFTDEDIERVAHGKYLLSIRIKTQKFELSGNDLREIVKIEKEYGKYVKNMYRAAMVGALTIFSLFVFDYFYSRYSDCANRASQVDFVLQQIASKACQHQNCPSLVLAQNILASQTGACSRNYPVHAQRPFFF